MRRLDGAEVAVTRAADASGRLVALLEEEGATTVSVPVIGIGPPDDDGRRVAAAAAALRPDDVVVVTSAHGAQALLDHAAGGPPEGVLVAAVGPATAGALAETAWEPALVPAVHTATALVAELTSAGGPRRVVYVAAAEPRPELMDGLRRVGWPVEHVVAYRTRLVAPGAAAVASAEAADVITFTSGSTVEGWLAVSSVERTPAVATIGPTTTAVATHHGLRVAAEAEVQSLAGLVDAVVVARQRPSRPDRASS